MREREKAGTPASVERRAVTRLLAGSLFLALVIAGFFSTDAGAQQQRSIEAVILRPAPNPTFDEIFDAIVVGVRSRERFRLRSAGSMHLHRRKRCETPFLRTLLKLSSRSAVKQTNSIEAVAWKSAKWSADLMLSPDWDAGMASP